jgi:hypothetical protein
VEKLNGKHIALGLVALLGGAILFYVGAGGNNPAAPQTNVSHATATPTPQADAHITFAPNSAPIPNGTGATVSTQKTWDGSKLFKEYGSTNDLRLFVETAKRSPEAGGVYYAEAALRECRLLRDINRKPEADRVRNEIGRTASSGPGDVRLAALNWVENRCQSFTDGELSFPELKSLKSSREASLDPLWNLRTEAFKTPTDSLDAVQRERLLVKLLSAREPGLLDAVRSLASAPSGTESLHVIYVNSVPNGGLDGESFELAWRLMTCKAADTCGLGDVRTKRTCAYLGLCANSIGEEVQMQSGTQFSRISAVADQLLQIVDQGNVRGLLSPS